MTIRELRATLGIPADLSSASVLDRDGVRVIAWSAPLAGLSGWWWAVTPGGGDGPSDDHEVIVSGWAAGKTRDRDQDIRRALAARVAARELVS